MSPLTIDDEAVAAVLDVPSVERALEEVFQDFAGGNAQCLPRQRIECGGARLSTMGGIWLSKGVAGTKSYPTVGGQFKFIVNLFDLHDQWPPVVLQGFELTRFRTAAIVTLAARKLASRKVRKIAIFGFGAQGRTMAEALCAAFKPDVVCVVDPRAQEVDVQRLASGVAIRASCSTSALAVKDADVVVTATRSKSPLFDGELLAPGAAVLAIGTSLPSGSELDAATLQRAARVIVGWKPQSFQEAGEIVHGRQSGMLPDEKIVDLVQLYQGGVPWREGDQDIVVFKSVRIGLADVATAWLAHSRLQAGLSAGGRS